MFWSNGWRLSWRLSWQLGWRLSWQLGLRLHTPHTPLSPRGEGKGEGDQGKWKINGVFITF